MKTTSGEKTRVKLREFALEVLDILPGLVVGCCLAQLIVPTYIVDFMKCDGPSMMPLFNSKGDIILVDKISPHIFGIAGGDKGLDRARFYRHQQRQRPQETDRTEQQKDDATPNNTATNDINNNSATLPFSTYRLRGLTYGDVVVVEHPLRAGTVCKRIVALPGDIVVAKRENTTFVVPDGHLWIEGDNKENSTDSRCYGPVPASLVIGKVRLRMWPLRGNAIIRRNYEKGDAKEYCIVPLDPWY